MNRDTGEVVNPVKILEMKTVFLKNPGYEVVSVMCGDSSTKITLD